MRLSLSLRPRHFIEALPDYFCDAYAEKKFEVLDRPDFPQISWVVAEKRFMNSYNSPLSAAYTYSFETRDGPSSSEVNAWTGDEHKRVWTPILISEIVPKIFRPVLAYLSYRQSQNIKNRRTLPSMASLARHLGVHEEFQTFRKIWQSNYASNPRLRPTREEIGLLIMTLHRAHMPTSAIAAATKRPTNAVFDMINNYELHMRTFLNHHLHNRPTPQSRIDFFRQLEAYIKTQAKAKVLQKKPKAKNKTATIRPHTK